MKLSEIKNGEVYKDGEFDWLGLTAEEYDGKKHLIFLNDELYLDEILKNKTISAIITNKQLSEKLKDYKYGLLIAENPKKIFFELHNELARNNFYFTKEENKISAKAKISRNAFIGDFNITIEDGVIIEDNVKIYPNVTIKKNSIIRSGSTIGGNGFEFMRIGKEVLSVVSIGRVIICENVEIQNNCTIDKGVFGDTILKSNVKLDNLVHVGHDVKIDENSFLTAGVILAGRVKVGKNSYLGPNCTIKNGLTLGENSRISMGSVVTKDVKANETVTGNFAIEHNKFINIFKMLLNLGEDKDVL